MLLYQCYNNPFRQAEVVNLMSWARNLLTNLPYHTRIPRLAYSLFKLRIPISIPRFMLFQGL